MDKFLLLIRRELRQFVGRGSNYGLSLMFFLALVVLFPFGIGPEPDKLSLVGPAVLWTGPLLAILLGLEKLFQEDDGDGSLDLYMGAPLSLEMIVFAKASAFWLVNAVPLILIAPLFGLMLNMEANAIWGTLITLLAGTPALVFFGTLGAAITIPIQRSGVLLAVLIIPFLIPALIFGVSAAQGFVSPVEAFRAPFLLLCAFSLFSLILCPIAGAAAIRARRHG